MADPVLYNQPSGQTTSTGQAINFSGVSSAIPPTVNTMPTTTPPVATPTTPPVPSPVSINVNPAPTTPQDASGTTKPTQPTGTTTNTPALTMPPNGSVVDLLNAAGQDSSQAARKDLASQFGVQGYDFSAAKNQELANKYLDFYNSKKGTAAPATNPRQEIQDGTAQTPDPQQSFFDQYMSMNPVVKNLYDSISQTLSSIGTQQTFTEQYQDLVKSQGIEGLQTDLMNINNIMDGTEDDIRTEIVKAGGFATDSQVQALTGARNKTLLKQANLLTNQLQAKEDYVNNIMDLAQADRGEVDKQIDQKINLSTKLADIQDKITTAAKDNYQKVVDTAGYQGLAAAIAGDPQSQKMAEQSLGLPTGSLKIGSSFLSAQPTDNKPLQFVSGTENQASGVFDPNTGKFSALGGGGGSGGGSVPLNSDYAGVISTILGSGKFTKQQATAITNAINNGEDPFTVVKNQAKQIMGSSEATKLSAYEAADSAMRDLQKNLTAYYDGGGDTGLLSGNFEQVANKLGQVNDPKKVALATQVAVSLQAYRNAISGTAYSNQEGQQINSVFPGINKSHGLNDAIIKGRLTADQSLIDGIYKTAIGSIAYDKLKSASSQSTNDDITGIGPVSPALLDKAKAKKFDIAAAMKAGYSLTEISTYLNK